MAKKQKCKCDGAPAWMVTFSDMMTLLLCFFVLIVSFSEIKRDGKYEAVIEEIREAWGMKGGGGRLPTEDDPRMSWIQRLVAVQLYQQRTPTRSDTIDPGIEGRQPQVTRVREGESQVLGGTIIFEPGSADLSEQAKRRLRQVAERMRGHNNLIEVRGHAATMELYQDNAGYGSLWELSYARTQSVMAYLTSNEVGLRPERFRLIANADREPVAHRVYTDMEQQPNRRVEIFEIESLVRDFQQPEF